MANLALSKVAEQAKKAAQLEQVRSRRLSHPRVPGKVTATVAGSTLVVLMQLATSCRTAAAAEL
jgi:hypothetical protein